VARRAIAPRSVGRAIPRACALFVALVLFSGQQAGAFHSNDTPLLTSNTAPGPAWTSYAFSTDGSKVATDLVASGVGFPIQAAIYLYGGDQRLVVGFAFTILSAEEGVYIDLNPAGQPVHVDVTEPQVRGGVLEMGATINDPSSGGQPMVGDFKLLLWVSGTASQVDHSLRGESGVRHLGTDSGRSTFLYTSRDFEGAVNVQGGGGGIDGRVTADTHKRIDATGTLIGFYRASSGSVEDMSVDTPFGNVDCPCTFPYFLAEASQPFRAGSYRFNLTGAGASSTSPSEVILGGADARLA
jgi:hypothetical protein